MRQEENANACEPTMVDRADEATNVPTLHSGCLSMQRPSVPMCVQTGALAGEHIKWAGNNGAFHNGTQAGGSAFRRQPGPLLDDAKG